MKIPVHPLAIAAPSHRCSAARPPRGLARSRCAAKPWFAYNGFPVACTADAALRAAGIGVKRTVRGLEAKLPVRVAHVKPPFAGTALTTPASMLALRALRPPALRPAAPAMSSTTTVPAWALGRPTSRTRRACWKSGGAHMQPAARSPGTECCFSHFQLGWASVEPSTPVTPGSNGACCWLRAGAVSLTPLRSVRERTHCAALVAQPAAGRVYRHSTARRLPQALCIRARDAVWASAGA